MKERLHRMSQALDQGSRGSIARAQREILERIERVQWKSSFFGRLVALVKGERELRRLAHGLLARARSEGIDGDSIRDTITLGGARIARRSRSLTTRIFARSFRAGAGCHRWVAALMVLLVIVHVLHALFYGGSIRGPSG
jgi:hypothetical protein